MVFHALLDDGATDVYTVQAVLDLEGPLDAGRLRAAAEALVARHANLRAAFRAQGSGQHVAVVRRTVEVPWREIDSDEDGVAAVLDEDRAKPFDLAKPPLLRFTLVRLGGDRARLVLSSHHLLWDGWSAPILVRELLELYADASPLPRVRPYRDHLAWLSKQDNASADTAWARALDGLDGPTLLAPDAKPGGLPRRAEFRLPAEETARLTRVARERGLTVNTVVQGVWSLLAGALSGRTDVVFGATVSGRSPELPGVETMVGMFINTVPVRVRLDAAEPLADLFSRLQAEQAALGEHHHRGLADIQRAAGQGALFDSLVVFESYPADAAALARASGPEGPVLTGVSVRDATHYPLTLLVVPGDELTVNFDHDVTVFDADTVAGIFERFTRILAQFLDDPALRTGRVDALGPVPAIEGARADNPAITLVDMLAEQATKTPDATALIFEGTTLTYRELDARADTWSRRLAALGVRPETTVGVHLERSPELVIALLATLRAGGAYVPLDPSYPAERLAYMVSDAEPVLVLSTTTRRGELSDVDVLCLDADESGKESTVERARPGNTAYVIYTSGSTGRPKGVAVSHEAIVNRLLWTQSEYGLTAEDRVLQKTPSSFDVSVWEFFWPLVTGAALVLAKPDGHKDPAYLASLIEAERVSTVHFVPSMLAEFLRAPEAVKAAGLSRILCSGEALSPEVRDRVRAVLGVPLHNLYGPTEAAVDVTSWACAEDHGPVPIGRPVRNTRVHVLDAFLRTVPAGVTGELYLEGVQLARGYLNRPGLTASRFVANPSGPGRLYRTGDLVRAREDGALEYFGRTDDQVKIRGFRIELGEVEATVSGLPGITAAAVVAKPDEQVLVAYVVPERQSIVPSAVRAELSRSLPEHLVPAVVVVLDALPLSPSGKLDQRALPEPDFTALTTSAPARSPREEILCGLFADVLGLPSVGAGDDFFALGGHSLLATRLVSRIRTALNADIAIRAVFDAPTVQRLAKVLDTGSSRPAAGPRPRPDVLPLSPAQRSLWFLYKLDGASPVYNLPFAVRLTGAVDVDALRAAVSDVQARHEALRTVFTEYDGEPRQEIRPAQVELAVSETSDLTADLTRITSYGFRLDEELPLRADLLRLGEHDHVLVLLVHHIAGDEWSGRPLVRELGEAYTARLSGEPPRWAELPLQYADYTLWQHELLDGVAAAQRKFWLERLEGLPEELPLPVDRPRPQTPTYRGDVVKTVFPAKLAAAARKLARTRGVSDLMLTQAAVAVLLHRLGAGDDIPLGTPSSGRVDGALESLVGFFVNSLVLRTGLSGDPSFRELLARVRTTNLDAYSNQDLPFERVVEAVNPPRSASRHPLFQVMVSHRDTAPELVLPGVTTTPAEVTGPAAKFDLSFVFDTTGDGLACDITYSTDLFDRSTVEGFAARLERLLTALVAKPERPVGLIDVLDETEHAQIRAWNDTAVEIPLKTLTEMVEEQVAATPDAPAVEFHDTTLTYRELNARANRLARELAALGVGPERTVGVHWERSLEMVVGLLAVEKAGGAFVPLEPSWPERRIEEVCENAGPTAVLSGSGHHDPLVGKGIPVVDVDLTEPVTDADDKNLGVEIQPEGLAYVIYTSGSTGLPKGAMIRHRAITHRLLWQRELLGFGTSDAALFKAPLGFDISINEVFLPLVTGGRLVVAEPGGERDIDYLLGLIERHRVTFTYLPSSILDLLVRLDGFAARGRSLKHVWCGGEVLTPELFHRFRAASDAVMYHGYGPAEATIGVSHVVYRHDAVRSAISIGEANGNTRLQVLDRRLLPVPVGVPGELYAGGVYLGRGYVNDPKRTADHFVADPYGPPGSRLYRTGDLARRQADGTLEFLGRADNQVKIRGMRVELEEIEAVLEQHEAIRRAVVLVREDQPGAKRLVGYGLATGESGLSDRVRDWLRKRLPEHMVPQALVFLPEFPLMPSGKVNRKALPEPDVEPRATGRAPASGIEKVLCGLMADLLKVPEVGVDDNFFTLGGDSILSIQWVSKARTAGVPISPRQVFELQTVAGLARAVADAEPGDVSPTIPGVGEVPLTPILRWWAESGDNLHQSALLRIPASFTPDVLGHVLDTHDLLRAKFADGILEVRPPGAVSAELTRIPVVEGDDLEALVRAHHAEATRVLDPAAGVVLRAVWFDLGERPGRLLLVLHHLAVDGVSWRVLAGDLAEASAALERGDAVTLAPVGTSFRAWATKLTEIDRAAESAHWTAVLDRPRKPLGARPLDPARDTVATTGEFVVTLTPAQTTPLLTDVPAAFRAGVNDVLLTALGLALAERTGDAETLVALEGHGREEQVVPGADLSRTVGWFTTVYPVLLDVGDAEPGDALKRVKEQLRAAPDNGIGFGLLKYSGRAPALADLPMPSVSFNYLGRFDLRGDDGFWVPAEESGALGGDADPGTPARYSLGVTAVTEDRADGPTLRVTWTWPDGVFTAAEIEALSAAWVRALEALAACATGDAGLTPSDVPLVSVNQAQLDSIAARWSRKRKGRTR